jgi:hypothetical protein
MSASPRSGLSGGNLFEHLHWSREEKPVARKAFDRALHRELEALMVEAKKRARQMRQPSDLWDLESFLTQCRKQIDREFDYRYSVLILVFGRLIRAGRLSEEELQGLSEDKLDTIRRFAAE